MQGQRVLATVTQLIMSELTPTVTAQHGAFFLTEADDDGQPRELRLIASYGYTRRVRGARALLGSGESLVGQAALERKTIEISDPAGGLHPGQLGAGPLGTGEHPDHADPVRGSGPGGDRAGLAAAALDDPSTFLEQLMETLGVVLNTIIANMRTEELLQQSQSLNAELEQQAQLLEERNLDIEGKNREIEHGAPRAWRRRRRSWRSPAATSPSSWPT